MKELKYNLKCLFRKKELHFSIIGILLINLIHIFLVIHYNYNFHVLYETGHRAEYLYILYNISVNLNMIIIIVFPILSSLIFSDINYLENRQKTNNLLHVRLNSKKLIISRFILIIITVFLINFIAFSLNYIVLNFIYGSGNAISYFQSPAFYMISNKHVFLDSLRLSNLSLFFICITAHVSFLISLLSGLAYAISFFVKQKIMIYISPFLILMMTELLLPLLNLSSYSIVGQLQSLSVFSGVDAIILYGILLICSTCLIIIHFTKKDLL